MSSTKTYSLNTTGSWTATAQDSTGTYEESEVSNSVNNIPRKLVVNSKVVSKLNTKNIKKYNDNNIMSGIVVTPSYPVKGDLINMTLGNATPAAGTQDQYRVLSINGSIAEVVAMYDQKTNQLFGTDNVYIDSELDIYFNSTWYETLNSTAKAAIVDKAFTQDSWYIGTAGSPVYNGYYGTTNPGTTSYNVSLGSTAYGSLITRHVYTISVQDIINYVKDTTLGDGELQNYNIWKMLWNTTSQPSLETYPWLRSACAESSSYAWTVSSYSGKIGYSLTGFSSNARPALTIDLSKITWSKVE